MIGDERQAHAPCYSVRIYIAERYWQARKVTAGGWSRRQASSWTRSVSLASFMPADATGNVVKLRTDDLIWQELDDEVVVLDLRASSYLRLNDTAATLFRELDRSGTAATLVSTILAAYDVDPATARRGVDDFLEELDRRGLLVEERDEG